ncbi:right-handed parallel beta-helix repeat-containing protein [Bacteroidota bacterium]
MQKTIFTMNLYFLLMLSIFLIEIPHMYAQTSVPPGDVSGTWTQSNTPYNINGEITIPDGKTLIIEPGVEVVFTGHYKFIVKGRLLAVGTKLDTITFTANDESKGWHGIKLLDISSSNDSTILLYCIFQFGKANTGSGRIDRCGGAINTNLNKLRISHCLFRNNMTYSTSIFESAGGAIALSGGGDPIIEYCEFIANESVYGAVMVIDGNSTDPFIRNNYIHDNNGHGTFNIGGGASPILINNLIANNHSTIHGIMHFAGEDGIAEMINNTIVNNTCSDLGGAVFVNDGLEPLFINNIIFGNEPSQVHLLKPSSLSFFNCLVEGGINGFTGSNFSGAYENCMDSNPLFVNSNDFHLQNTSDCIGAGYYDDDYTPLIDYEGNLRPNPMGSNPDIGAFENELGSPVTDVTEEINQLPSKFVVSQNYPNPFNPSTTIKYEIPNQVRDDNILVTLVVFDILGKEVVTLVNEHQKPGSYEVELSVLSRNAEMNLSSGVYFYQLRAGKFIESKKMVLMK